MTDGDELVARLRRLLTHHRSEKMVAVQVDLADLAAAVELLEPNASAGGDGGTPRMFPLQPDRKYLGPAGQSSIPWSVADKAYSVYRARYGSAQSLERLAERGGFSHGEMDELYPGWRDEASEVAALRTRLAEAEQALTGRTVSCAGCEATARERDAARAALRKLAKAHAEVCPSKGDCATLQECRNVLAGRDD